MRQLLLFQADCLDPKQPNKHLNLHNLRVLLYSVLKLNPQHQLQPNPLLRLQLLLQPKQQHLSLEPHQQAKQLQKQKIRNQLLRDYLEHQLQLKVLDF